MKRKTSRNHCPNCGAELFHDENDHEGWGAGPGTYSSGRSVCSSCGNGCYKWDHEDTPGFRDRWKSKCCKCKK